MRSIESLSKIGFGSQYSFQERPEHYQGIVAAVKNGCNLIDTSVTYGQGSSEKLVGQILQEFPDKDLFVITKAGHAFGNNIDLLNGMIRDGLKEYVILGDNFKFSIDPAFLDAEFNISLKRHGRSFADCFLLHNPERYFRGGGATQEEYYARIKKAFVYLEEQVQKGRLRYYGVSSNTLPQATSESDTTSLPKLLEIATEVSADHHFKFIQFPYNLFENGASQQAHYEGKTLLQIAKEAGIITLSNRPLHALIEGNYILLASYDDKIADLDEDQDRLVIQRSVDLMQEQLIRLGRIEEITDFPVVKTIKENWQNFGSLSGLEYTIANELNPFLEALYDGQVPEKLTVEYDRLRKTLELYAMKRMSEIAYNIRQQFFGADTTEQLQL
ncbi:MAG: aldo/keto reductase, partial [Phaeodactylibacter sp.]|nr:aldo/keto reductase [Phaeodactylibacter sp.]